MRLTGGEHRGRRLQVPACIRPTQDKVRAAVFSILAPRVPGARVLDLFAGTGAMGLEAWSRGAHWVEWIENRASARRALHQNLNALGVAPEAGHVAPVDVFQCLRAWCPGPPFDIILADPPYAPAQEGGWMEIIADLLARNHWVERDSVFVFETEGHATIPALTGWRLARDKTYGATRILLWVFENAS